MAQVKSWGVEGMYFTPVRNGTCVKLDLSKRNGGVPSGHAAAMAVHAPLSAAEKKGRIHR